MITTQLHPLPATPLTVPPPPADSAYLRLAMWVAVYAIAAISMMTPIEDFDIWWHLRTADWIVDHGMLPPTEPFSQFGEGKLYVAYSWLFEMLAWGPYQLLGLTGILVFRAFFLLLLLGVIHWFIAKRQPGFVPCIGLFALTCIAFVPLYSERPWVFSILFWLLTLDAILDARQGNVSWTFWILPLWYILWANLHIQFVYGLFLLGLACGAPVIDWFLGRSPGGENADSAGSRGWWRLVFLSVACGIATLVNPYHVELYSVVREYSRHTATYGLFPELKAFEFRQLPDWTVLGLTCAAAFALAKRQGLSAFDVLLFAVTVFFSFKSRRDLWFVTLAAVAILSTTRWGPQAVPDTFPLTWPRKLILTAGVLAVLLVTAWQRGLWGNSLSARLADTFPVEAAQAIEDRGETGPVFNHVDWGGYLIWRLPNLKPAIDGRSNLHGDKRLRRLQDTWEARPGWDEDPELKSARLVILQSWSPLAQLLLRDDRFERIHQDRLAIVFVRRGK